MKTILPAIRASVALMLIFTVLLGVVYPVAVTVVAEIFFAHRAEGSFIERGDKIVGSRLLGQQFSSPHYFWGRLSATAPAYNAASSAGSNLNPANPKLLDAVNARIDALRKADPDNKALIPVDLVTASASGLDPHISPEAAQYQAARVARARHMAEADVHALVEKFTEERTLGFIGEPRVNVLLLNLALDEKK